MRTAEAEMMMAEDPFLREEYEKYRYDMLEQGLEPMTFEQFRREALAGMAKSQPKRNRRRDQREKSNYISTRWPGKFIGGLDGQII